MYKCKECNAEYEVKPDYCDCGNDIFEEISVKAEEILTPPVEKENVEIEQSISAPVEKKDDNLVFIEGNGFGYPIDEKTYEKHKKNSKIKPYAVVIFTLCILLSILVVLFAWNPKETDLKSDTANKDEKVQENIPSIEKLWNNKPPVQTSNNQKSKNETVPEKKIQKQAPAVSQTSPQKPVKTTKNSVKTPTPTKTQNKVQNNSPKIQTVKPAETKQTKNITVNPQEVANYKIKLRNHIASKISFASVVGDGSCTFSFSVSNNGELTSKKPVSLSDNDSLNEAVYNALRQVYSYNPPPQGYKSGTLNLTVKMYNNNFEVSLN